MPNNNSCLGLSRFLLAFGLLASALVAARSRAQTVPRPPGKLVDVGGHRMHVWCSGAGSPVVVVENGLGDFSTDWSLVASRVAGFTRICVYDRAGYAWSEPGPLPRTFDQINLELHEALLKLGEHGPFVLVGHSYGGAVVRNFPVAYPRDVAGLVLVDTIHEDQRIPMGPSHLGLIRDDAKGRAIRKPRLQIEPQEKITKGAPPSTDPLDEDHLKLPKEDQLVDLWAEAQPSLEAAENSQREWSAEYFAKFHSMPQKRIFGGLPLIVLTREKLGYEGDASVPTEQLENERLTTQKKLTELSSNSIQIMVPSGHQMHLEAPDSVAAAIRKIVTAIRTKQALKN
jgi:pimeloyl-ACP methyl ester carboxylesterase